MIKSIAIIIVTYNSEKHIHKAMECIRQQTVQPARIVLVDSGSKDPSYLERYRQQGNVTIVIAEKGCGFCRGNNAGMPYVQDCKYVLFLNPDAFLTPSFLEGAVGYMEKQTNAECGALTGVVEGYAIEQDQPTGKYDTTGVFRNWYGRWYDRGQGTVCRQDLYNHHCHLPAICGALMFCRKTALDTVLIRNGEVFDSTFYMYKEDIDLSLRLRKKAWTLDFVPYLHAYHCRGWQQDRSKMPRIMRLASARNEFIVQTKIGTPLPIAYSLLKYAAVKIFNI